MSDHILFVVAPYLAAVALIGATLRALFDRSRYAPSRPTRTTSRMFGGRQGVLRIGLLGTLAGHLLMVGWPAHLVAWNQHVGRLLAFEIVFFLFGALAIGGLVAVIGINTFRAAPRTASLIYVAFVGVLFVTLLSGLGIAVLYRWASVWSTVMLTPYVRSLPGLAPDLQAVTALPYLVKLHLFSTWVLAGLLACSGLVRVFVSPVNRAVDRAVDLVVTPFSRRSRPLREWARESGRNLLWPEEED